MLSEREHADTKWKLDNIPSSVTGTTRQNYRQILKKKLKEHKYASMYPPFEPLPYFIYHINRTTSEATLNQIIQAATTTNIFTLDTESVNIYKKENKPVLIQIQIILPYSLSIVLIFEACHLPPEYTSTFELIKEFFKILLVPNKIIYIWGEIQELIKFTTYKLFSEEQCSMANYQNLQNIFKMKWQELHPHVPSDESSSECLCEKCINISPSNPWGLQDAVAFQLHEWLDKRVTRSAFDIGLDKNLFHMNELEIQHRNQLTKYAADDCLSMHRILISLKLIETNFRNTSTTTTTTHERQRGLLNEEALPDGDETRVRQQKQPSPEIEFISSSDDEDNMIRQTTPESNPITKKSKYEQELSEHERKRIHNRSCTLKQRKRNYQYKIVIRNIDRRFKIREIKMILRQNNVQFHAIKIPTSKMSNENSLIIGIREKSLIRTYERRIGHLFTMQHYDDFQSSECRTKSSSYSTTRRRL